MEFTAKQLAKVLKGTVDGDPEVKVTSFAKIEHGKEGQLCFFANPKYEHYVYTCKASILLVNNTFEPKQPVSCTMIRVADAYTAVAELLKYVATQKRTDRRHRGFRSSWFLTTKFGKKVYLGSHSYVGHHAVVGDYTKIYENVYVGDNTKIGSHCIIYPGVCIYPGMIIGDNVIIHSNAVIGSDGFGNAPQPDGTWEKIEHLGNVIIGDNVEIGAGTTIDKSEMESTIIGKGVKIDNLCQIAHNVVIGDNTVMRYRRFCQDRKELHHRRSGRYRGTYRDSGQYHHRCTGRRHRQHQEIRRSPPRFTCNPYQELYEELRCFQAAGQGIIRNLVKSLKNTYICRL